MPSTIGQEADGGHGRVAAAIELERREAIIRECVEQGRRQLMAINAHCQELAKFVERMITETQNGLAEAVKSPLAEVE